MTFRRLAPALLLCALPSLALAHPGHDDEGLTWDLAGVFSHHPMVAVAALTVIGVGAWKMGVFRKRS